MNRRRVIASVAASAAAMLIGRATMAQQPKQENGIRKHRYWTMLLIEVDFVNNTSGVAARVAEELRADLRRTAERLSVRTLRGIRVVDFDISERLRLRYGSKRSYGGHIITELDMVDDSDGAAENVMKHLGEELQAAVQNFSRRTVRGSRVVFIHSGEIKA